MPHRGGRKRTTPRKAYAQKAAQKAHGGSRVASTVWPKANDAKGPFSMSDAARNTGHRGDWGDKKLRHTQVVFVSAGSAVTSLQEEETSWFDNEDNLESTSRPAAQSDSRVAAATSNTVQPKVPSIEVPATEAGLPSSDLFFIDTTGDATINHADCAGPTIPAAPIDADEADFDSSEEVVVFKGKKTTTGKRESPRSQSVRILEEDIATNQSKDEGTPAGIQIRRSLTPDSSLYALPKPDSNAEEEAENDYISNLMAQGISEKDLRAMGFLADPVDLIGDLDGDASGSDSTGDLSETDEDGDSGNDDDGDLENELSNLDIDSEDEPPDEAQLGQAASAMSDEQIARRLAKQEELGLGSDEILLFGQDDMTGIFAEEEDQFALDFLRNAASRLTGQSKRSKTRKKSLLPDMIDELDGGQDYGDFDVMDFDRPSLQRRGKKSKGLPFAVSDSELEATMAATWENDRNKKKQRKQEREQLRAEGLLNGGSESAQLRARYADGMGMTQIREEIKTFLASSRPSLSLVAMDKSSRKAVHEIANRLNIRSKSKGDGLKRYPVLYRTSITLEFDEVMVDAVLRRHSAGKGGRFKFSGLGKSKPEKGTRRARGGWGGGARDAATYRDGETVGASAPALGVENRGHAMLAKMGWTMGTGLGALNNQGKLEPVPHVVKATRAGLG